MGSGKTGCCSWMGKEGKEFLDWGVGGLIEAEARGKEHL